MVYIDIVCDQSHYEHVVNSSSYVIKDILEHQQVVKLAVFGRGGEPLANVYICCITFIDPVFVFY